MVTEEEEKLLEEERERIAEEEKSLRKEMWIKISIGVITLIIIGLVVMVLVENILDYREQKITDAAAAEAEAERIAQEKEAAQLAAEVEAARIAALINPNLTNFTNYWTNSTNVTNVTIVRMTEDELNKICLQLFEKGMNDYDDYFFEDKEDALDWLDEETIEREDKSKTFDERVLYQIRYAFLTSKIGIAQSIPISIAVGELDSDNFNESTGLLCTNEGLVSITGDGKDNLIYQTTMRREWV